MDWHESSSSQTKRQNENLCATKIHSHFQRSPFFLFEDEIHIIRQSDSYDEKELKNVSLSPNTFNNNNVSE